MFLFLDLFFVVRSEREYFLHFTLLVVLCNSSLLSSFCLVNLTRIYNSGCSQHWMKLYYRCFELIIWELLPILAAYHLLSITDFPRVIVSWYYPLMGSINTSATKRWLRMSHVSWKISLKAILLKTSLLSFFSVLLKKMVSRQNFVSFIPLLLSWLDEW